MAWFPAWWTIGEKDESKLQKTDESLFHTLKQYVFRIDIIIPLFLAIFVLVLLFGDAIFAILV